MRISEHVVNARVMPKFSRSPREIRPAAVPQRRADYGGVYGRPRSQLIPYEKKTAGWRGWAGWRGAAITVACAMLLAAVFLGGRYWERGTTKKANVTDSPQATQRVVLVVLTDHLDRTERLLVQLEHSQSPDSVENDKMQSEARELLASNRHYLVTASNSSDAELAGAHERQEDAVAEIANDPNLTAADLKRVRKDMNTKGILFEIRVLQTRSQDQGTKGATI
jgi:hypothetical protein